MANRRYKEGINRRQLTMFPPSLEAYVTEANPVRGIDAYVESLDLHSYGFQNTVPVGASCFGAGQPAYPPQALLKLHLYGDLNRVRSRRRLEKETHRNVEVIWLVEGLRPSCKTIADFRKDNAKALRRVNNDFVVLCKELELFGGGLAGIDGRFFKADASKASIQTRAQLKRELQRIEEEIAAYQEQLKTEDENDDAAGRGSDAEDGKLEEKLETLKARQSANERVLEAMEGKGETQRGRTDGDARRLIKNGQKVAGHNVQHVIDDKPKLIVDHEVTHDGKDSQQLAPMAKRAKETLESEALTVLADSGYSQGEQIKDCIENGITPFVALPNKNKPIADQGRDTRDPFEFDAENNRYRCPAGQYLEQQGNAYDKRGRKMIRHAGKSSICGTGPDKEDGLTEKAKYRQIVRWEHEMILEEHRRRMEENGPERMRKRSGLAEPPFGTLKRRMGRDHFLVRGFRKVRGEMSRMVLGDNFTRALNIIGLQALRDHCAQNPRQWQENAEVATSNSGESLF